jgi:hypothetical protein
MIIKCYRCQKNIDTPSESNADYITSTDVIVKEARECLVAVRHTDDTIIKAGKKQTIDDKEYERVTLPDFKMPKNDDRLVRVEVASKDFDIQKTAIICPDCFNPETDTVIWGVHKKAANKNHISGKLVTHGGRTRI